MKILKNLKIGRKLTLGFVVMILFMMVIGLNGYDDPVPDAHLENTRVKTVISTGGILDNISITNVQV